MKNISSKLNKLMKPIQNRCNKIMIMNKIFKKKFQNK